MAVAPARSPAATQGPPPGLPEVLAIALRNNPDIVAGRLRVDSARAEQSIARALPNPTYNAIPNVPYQHSVTQLLDIGPQRIYRTRAAGRGAAATTLELQDIAGQVTFAVRAGYFDLLLADALRRVAGTQRDIFRQLLAGDSVRVRAGDLPARNLAASEVQLARADAAMARANIAVREARLALQALMGVRAPDTAFTVSGELSYRPLEITPESLLAVARVHRADLAAARLRVDQSKALRSFATSQLIPTPALNVTYQSGQPFGNGRQYELGVGVTVPLFYWYGGERRRARAAEAAADLEVRRVSAQLDADVLGAIDAYGAARDLVVRYQDGLVAKAQASLDAARYAYQRGAASQLDVLEAARAYADTRTDYYTTLHDYWVSAYALDRAVGRDLIP